MKYLHPKRWLRITTEILKIFWNYYILPDKIYLKKQYYQIMGEKLNLKNPKKFTEKIQWLKLNDRNPDYHKMVDKYDVKLFVEKLIGSHCIIPTLGVWEKFDEIDFDKLPSQFVLKCTHDSASVVICKDKNTFNFLSARKKLEAALKINYYRHENKQWAYNKIKPRIIAEKYLDDLANSEIKDYKFYCFNGNPKYCQVIANRQTKETIDFYDEDWNHQNFIGLLDGKVEILFSEKGNEKPDKLDEMLRIASKLSKDIPYVRVDLYCIKDNIYFGEMTFYPAGGLGFFKPKEWDLNLGNLINLHN